jgi:molecular chaperone GrpE
VSSETDKAPELTTQISEDVINEALASVERRERAASGDASEPSVSVEAVAAEARRLGEEVAALRAEVTRLREAAERSAAGEKEAQEKLRAEHERLLRAAADLENARKRALREVEEVKKFAAEKLLRDVLPVHDNLERALEHARASDDFASLRTGMEMIHRLLVDTLGKHQLRPFTSAGEPFDPARHEAMSMEPTAEMPANRVLREIVKGFTLADRLIRPALVVVSQAPPGATVDAAAASAAPAPDAAAPSAAAPEAAQGASEPSAASAPAPAAAAPTTNPTAAAPAEPEAAPVPGGDAPST